MYNYLLYKMTDEICGNMYWLDLNMYDDNSSESENESESSES